MTLAEPKKLFLRRRDVLEWTGLSVSELNKFISAGLVTPVRIRQHGSYNYFRKDEIKALIETFGKKE